MREQAVPRYGGRRTLALDRLHRIAGQLGPLADRVVFIGGAVAPLLQTDALLPTVRPTHDVDAVIATTSYAELGPLHAALRALGFNEVSRPAAAGALPHMHRWMAPDHGGPFDLMPIGNHTGGTGGHQDRYAVESAVRVDLGNVDTMAPCIVQHVNAVAFLLLKWAAFEDRGRSAPFESHDLEDIIAVVASRPSLVGEVDEAPRPIRTLMASCCRAFMTDEGLAEELIAANLPLPAAVARHVRHDVWQRLHQLARGSGAGHDRSHDVTIRQAVPSDATRLAELGAETFRETFAADNTPDDLAAHLASSFAPEIQARELVDPAIRYGIAEVAGEPAGYAQLVLGHTSHGVTAQRPVEIRRLYARRAVHGQGVGSALMTWALDEARMAGADAVWLGVWERNARAIAFYERWGFRMVGEHLFLLGTDRQRDLVMQRDPLGAPTE